MADRAKIVEILDAVVEELNEAELPLKIAAQRVYAPAIELTDPRLRVFVYWPGEVQVVRNHRQERSETYTVEVAVMKRVACPANDQCDPLVHLCQSIGDMFFTTHNGQERLQATGAACTDIPQSRFDYERLTESNEFCYVWQFAFQVER